MNPVKFLLTRVLDWSIREPMTKPYQLSAYTALAQDQSPARVDADSGIIYGVSVITEGEAIGHQSWVDAVTLDQVSRVASEFRGGLRVNNNHRSDLFAASGFLKNFRIEKRDGLSRVLADLHVLKSDANREKLLELADAGPDTFGLSVVMSGPHEKRDGKTFLRCDELLSADLVPSPAANPTGLFSKPETNHNANTMTEEEIKKLVSETVSESFDSKITEMQTALESKIEEVKTLAEGNKPDPTELEKQRQAAEQIELEKYQNVAKGVAQELLKELKITGRGPGNAPAPENNPAEKFEDKAIAYLAEGKSKGESIQLASKQHKDLHADYLARCRTGEIKPIAV